MPAASQNSGPTSLPLFRPEALAAQQQKFHGEIVLIRPFSLALLSWIAIGIAAVVLGFLFLGRYTERIRTSGAILTSSSAPENLQAFIFIPGRQIKRIHTGDRVSLRCADCSMPFSQWTGTVLGFPAAPLGEAERSQLPVHLAAPVYRIAVSLPPQAAQISQDALPQTGTAMEAEIPLGRKPLIKWVFERSGS